MHGSGEVEKLSAGEPLVEIEFLGEDPDSRLDLGWRAPGVVGTDSDRARGRTKQTDDALDGRRLPGTVLPEEPVELSGHDVEVDAVYSPGLREVPDKPAGPHSWCGRGVVERCVVGEGLSHCRRVSTPVVDI